MPKRIEDVNIAWEMEKYIWKTILINLKLVNSFHTINIVYSMFRVSFELYVNFSL
jgi:hypothetical protein